MFQRKSDVMTHLSIDYLWGYYFLNTSSWRNFLFLKRALFFLIDSGEDQRGIKDAVKYLWCSFFFTKEAFTKWPKFGLLLPTCSHLFDFGNSSLCQRSKLYINSLCITASGNILASGNFLKKLLKVPLETIELLIFWYVVAEHHLRNYRRFSTFNSR